jgi:branched-chain amino acid transport system ATP-binding protein
MAGNEVTILKVSNLTKRFGGLIAVNDVSLHVNEGEIVGLIGANGAGKTTLFNMIAGEFSPTSGEINYMGKNIKGMHAYKISRMGIGRTYQIVQPFSNLTVLENTMVGCFQHTSSVENARTIALEILKQVELDNRKDIRGSDLNLPELKRMELARALATKPRLLLLDEVMAGLNPADSMHVVELIRKIRENNQISLIIIEHVMKAIMSLSDRIYALNQGLLIAEGTPQEVSRNPEVIKSYFGEKRYGQK